MAKKKEYEKDNSKGVLGIIDELIRLAEEIVNTFQLENGSTKNNTTLLDDKVCEYIEPESVMNTDNHKVNIIVDMPGVSKNEIVVVVKGDNIIILGGKSKVKYYKSIRTPFPLDERTLTWNYSNGILKITCYKKDIKRSL